jgi:hypothetical protein
MSILAKMFRKYTLPPASLLYRSSQYCSICCASSVIHTTCFLSWRNGILHPFTGLTLTLLPLRRAALRTFASRSFVHPAYPGTHFISTLYRLYFTTAYQGSKRAIGEFLALPTIHRVCAFMCFRRFSQA